MKYTPLGGKGLQGLNDYYNKSYSSKVANQSHTRQVGYHQAGHKPLIPIV